MIIEQIYTNCLAEAAYYIESDGEAAVIDPMREVGEYIERAEKSGATIKYVLETHFHADFISGHLDLARKTNATIVFGPKAETSFDAHVAADGEILPLGKIKIKVLHTPGHTPESSCYLLLDENDKPHALFSGDTLFIGDVGRPDLAVKSDLTREDLAKMLYYSLRKKIMSLPDDVIVYPAHGAGSACGKNMSSETSDTLGSQKVNNYALDPEMSEDDFVKELITGILPPPQYFPKAATINKSGYSELDELLTKGNRPLDADAFTTLMEEGALILDTRSKETFREAHIPGSLFIGIDGSFAVWAGTLIEDLHQPIILLADEGREEEVITRLARVGYDNCRGYLKGGIDAWTEAGGHTDEIKSLNAGELNGKIFELNATVLDVRKESEYDAGHVVNAELYPLDFINQHLNDLDKDKPYLVHCRSGYRSLVAISILKQEGYEDLYDVKGGYLALEKTDVSLQTPAIS